MDSRTFRDSTPDDSERPAPVPPVPGRTLDERIRAIWELAFQTSNRQTELHDQMVIVDTGVTLLKREMRHGFAALGVTMPKEHARPHRDEEPSQVNLEKFAEKVASAALEGERDPNATPEGMVRRVVVEEQRKREEERELAKYRKQAREHEQSQQRQKDQRKRSLRKIFETAAGGLAITGAVELLRYFLALPHH